MLLRELRYIMNCWKVLRVQYYKPIVSPLFYIIPDIKYMFSTV